MVKYNCPTCNFTTDRKSNYERHLKTSKCSNNNSISSSASLSSSVSNLTDEEMSINNRILELENQLKIKDLELQMKDLEIKHLKEINLMLKNEQQVKPSLNKSNNISVSITEKQPNVFSKAGISDLLKKERSEVISIEDFIKEYLKNPTYNNYLKTTLFNNEELIVSKNVTVSDYNKNLFVTQICNLLNKIPHNKRPIYCSNIRLHKFYIYSNGKWLEPNDEENDKLIKNLINELSGVLTKSLGSIIKQNPKNPKHCCDDNYNYDNDEYKKYEKQKYKFNNFFKNMYNLDYEVWDDKHKMNIITHLINDEDELNKLTKSLKIELSKITSVDKEDYVISQETIKEEIIVDEEEEYDNENDPEWD